MKYGIWKWFWVFFCHWGDNFDFGIKKRTFLIFKFSVAKATLQPPMSVRSFVCLSVCPSPKPPNSLKSIISPYHYLHHHSHHQTHHHTTSHTASSHNITHTPSPTQPCTWATFKLFSLFSRFWQYLHQIFTKIKCKVVWVMVYVLCCVMMLCSDGCVWCHVWCCVWCCVMVCLMMWMVV